MFTQAVLTRKKGRKEREENQNMYNSKEWERNSGERKGGDKWMNGIHEMNEGSYTPVAGCGDTGIIL